MYYLYRKRSGATLRFRQRRVLDYQLHYNRLPLTKLLDEHNPTNYYWLLLQNDIEGNLPQLKVWTMFYPEDKVVPHLYPEDPVKSFAAQLLLAAERETDVVDTYKQPVHLGNYNPNYMRVEQDFMTGFIEGKGQSEEEKVISAMLLSKVDAKKASFEAWEYKLINAYRYLRQQARANIFNNMSAYLWDSYILKLMMNVTKTRTMQQFGPEEAARVESVIGNQIQKTRGSLLKLDRIRFWREAGSWKYSEIVALCKLGLPKELRPSIWSELFGLSGSRNPEFEEMKEARYYYYSEKGMNQDSVIFRQMEQDVLDITLTNITQPSDEILLHNERAGVLKVAKAYYAWCLDENAKNPKATRYAYFKGILHLIQKIWQIFVEVDVFWCIIGFAKTLPYLFQTQDVMTGGLSWSHKLLLLAISTVIEIKYPTIYKAILRHGLPVEYYISDKLFTMLSTVFPTDTLLRFYDIIALEAGSKEPIRAVWVLITGCIMLITLNETYIKAARNADEIELLINNTGINKLNTQKFVEQIYKMSSELFSTYHPSWERVLAVLIRKEDSAVGMEQAWTNKALSLDTKYKDVKELNKRVNDILKNIRGLSHEEVKEEEGMDDSGWVNNFVRRFCKYYGEYASKEIPDTVCIYIYKCCNLEIVGEEITVTYGDKGNETVPVNKEGIIEQMVELSGDPNETTIKILVPGATAGWCEIDLTEYETDTPITLDKPLIPIEEFGGEITHKGQKPQPFISMVLLVVSKSEGHIDDTYKHMKQSMMYESKIIRPVKREFQPKQAAETIAITKENIRKQFQHAGLQSIYTPGVKTVAGEATNAENDKAALRHLFTLLHSEAASIYAAAMPEILPEVEALTEKTYNAFAAHYAGKLPLKRVLVSIIAAATLTVDEKLAHFYDIYTSIAGAAGNSFLLEDIIELIQLLCELHLVYIPPEYIPHLAEQVMTNGGINRITNAYLLSADAKVSETLKEVHLKGILNNVKVIKVTEKVQDAFSRYWELWGHKQVFAGDPHSFCGSLNTVLGGYKMRPKNPGPYNLVICYKHRGQGYYKVFEYDEAEKLLLFPTTPNELNTLLVTNRNNLSFVGERLKMTKTEFISRIKRIPILSELMRLHISLNSSFILKHRTELLVDLMHGKRCVALVRFTPHKSRFGEPSKTPYEATPTGGYVEKPVYRFDSGQNRYNITMEYVYQEDLLAEVKGRILTAISTMINDIMQANPRAEIPDALNPSLYLNHSLQFFSSQGPLDDYVRLQTIVNNALIANTIERG
eukprot:TRINITY_DN253_c0_g1_i1.p1 TRINITY_DN253_c0_g1~~TRINITY_DN253_c0_g1_i1.p1  ORF type:complete len:1266 (+),score=158.97 TRINITY_DN253_c0_g1_i1:6145-9942(+)